MFCPNCGNSYPDGSKFCPTCGFDVEAMSFDNSKTEPKTTESKPNVGKKAEAVFSKPLIDPGRIPDPLKGISEKKYDLWAILASVFSIILAILYLIASADEFDSIDPEGSGSGLFVISILLFVVVGILLILLLTTGTLDLLSKQQHASTIPLLITSLVDFILLLCSIKYLQCMGTILGYSDDAPIGWHPYGGGKAYVDSIDILNYYGKSIHGSGVPITIIIFSAIMLLLAIGFLATSKNTENSQSE